jgi:hypothetical protein
MVTDIGSMPTLLASQKGRLVALFKLENLSASDFVFHIPFQHFSVQFPVLVGHQQKTTSLVGLRIHLISAGGKSEERWALNNFDYVLNETLHIHTEILTAI